MWITRVSINNPVFATMVMVALCVLGLFSYLQAGRRADARHLLPRRLDRGAYPGASPEAVEREIAKPLEEAVNSIAGVKRIPRAACEGRVR
jgi:multidrug efflux pump subunit AcrB